MSRFFDSVSLSLGIIEMLDGDFRYVAVNESGARIHGLKVDEMVGKTATDLAVPTEIIGEWIDGMAECSSTHAPVRFEYHRQTHNGDRWSCATISPFEGSSTQFCFIVEDLTDVKAQLRAQERKLRALVSNIPGTVFRAMVDDNYKLDFMSDQVTELLGYTPDEFVKREIKFSDLVLPEDYGQLVQAAERAREERTSYTVEYRIKNRRGEVLWVTERGKVTWDEDSKSLVLDGAIYDVTERRHMIEELIEAREAAMEASQLKSEFLANMSHEIRTPLNGVIGMTELLLGTSLDEDQKDYADTVLQSADTLLHIINDILDFSKIEAGKLSIERVEVDLGKLAQETAELLAAKAHQKGLELILDIPQSLPLHRFGDPVRVKQILVNLVSNAIKFTEVGEVTLQMEAQDDDGPTWIRLSVIDTGIGIDLNRHGAIFDSFTQADGSTTRRYGGTGLGLAIVRQLATLMGGRVGLTSEPGQGSKFWVDLPMELQAVQPQVASETVNLKGLRLLVVDDNATNRKVLTRLLAAHGCFVDSATCAAEAITSLTGPVEYDVVLLDYQMPDIDGLELARTISVLQLRKSPEVIMLSSVGQLVGHDILQRARIARSLTKPVRQGELLAVILEVSQGRQDRQALEAAPVGTGASDISILVVEDNFVNRKVCQKILERHGCRVHFAENGQEALNRIDVQNYDLVLMDLQMPVMDGFETTLAIRARDRKAGRHTPIVALTAHAMRGDKEKCLAIGMDDYLTKPVKPQDLDQVVARWSVVAQAA